MYDVAIMQPTYLPWSGYFHLMSQVKVFVFLDDVQFTKSSWQSRNRINYFGCVQWISLPLRHNGLQRINEVCIRTEAKWPKKHVQQLRSVYGKSPYYKDLKPIIEFMSNVQHDSLAKVNSDLIKKIARMLELDCEFIESSSIKKSADRSQRLLELITACGGRSYLSPEGSKGYLTEDGILESAGINVVFQEFVPEEYTQFKSDQWHSHLSIVDVIANMGIEKAKDYVRGIKSGV